MVLTFLPRRSASSLLVQASPPETTVSAAMARRSCSWVFVKRRFLGPRRAPALPAAPSVRARAGPTPPRSAPGSLGEHPPPHSHLSGLARAGRPAARGGGPCAPPRPRGRAPAVPRHGRPAFSQLWASLALRPHHRNWGGVHYFWMVALAFAQADGAKTRTRPPVFSASGRKLNLRQTTSAPVWQASTSCLLGSLRSP